MPKLIGWNVRFSYSPLNVPGDEGYTGSTPFKGGRRNWNMRRGLGLWARASHSWDEMKVVSAASSEASPHDDVSNPTTKLAEELRLWM